MMLDFRSAILTLLRRPSMTLVATLTLALGVGAATAIFSVVHAALVRPLDFPDAGRLVRIWQITPDGERFPVSGPDYALFAAASPGFDRMAAFSENLQSLAIGGSDPVRIDVAAVSASFFDVLGVQPAAGRGFTPHDDRPGPASRRIVLSHAVWTERFGGDPATIDRAVTVNGERFVVIGVMPKGFSFPSGARAWVPVLPFSDAMAEGKSLAVIGRLAEGVTLQQARAGLHAAAARVAERDPDANAGWSADLATFRAWLVPARFRQALFVIAGAICCLLLLACANVANLLLAHASRRQGELRLRAALGASRRRLVQLLFAESALLAIVGTALGVLLAMWLILAIESLGAGRIPLLEHVALQGQVLIFAATAGILCSIVSGTVPALHGSQLDLRTTLDQSLRVTRRRHRTRRAIVGFQVAMAMLLVTGAGLLTMSFARLSSVDPGFDTTHVLAVPLDLQLADADADATQVLARIAERIAAVPGVERVGATSTNPFRQGGYANSVTPEEARAFAPASGLLQAGWRAVTPGYFAAAGVPVIDGRAFSASDRNEAERVVMVSDRLARELWPDRGAVGRRILWGGLTGRPRTVVGVTGDIRDVSVHDDAPPMLFLPHAQVALPSMTLLVKAADASAVAPSVRTALREAVPAMPAPPIDTIARNRAHATAGPRFNAWLMGSFAAVAAVLAVTGLYSMLTFLVAERRREIAVRLALGARPAAILQLIMKEGVGLALAGLAAGLVAALWLARYLQTLLYDIRATDPPTFAAVAALLTALAIAASFVPARAAARMDPLDGLRAD